MKKIAKNLYYKYYNLYNSKNIVKKIISSKSFTVPVRVWEREIIGKSSNRIMDFGI